MSGLTRRRFLAISAAAVANVASAKASQRQIWEGRALGAIARVELSGPQDMAGPALQAVRDTLTRMEELFSLYRPTSALSRLNREKTLRMPPEFQRLVGLIDQMHLVTGGLFDPAVQSAFERHAAGNAIDAPISGWQAREITSSDISLPGPDMQLTFNGIAQGFATDRIAEVLEIHGFTDILVNAGEFRAGSMPKRLMAASPGGQSIGEVTLERSAAATSSPDSLRFLDGQSHIIHPRRPGAEPVWSTVTVVAPEATTADAVSTALCLSPDEDLAKNLVGQHLINGAMFVGHDRKVRRIGKV